MKVQFINFEHQLKFQKLQSQLTLNNKECLSVIFIMAGDEELHRKMSSYFDIKKGIFSSENMFNEQDFESGIEVLAKLAVHLFNNNETISPLDMVGALDDERLQLAINAILVRRYGISHNYDLPEEKFYM